VDMGEKKEKEERLRKVKFEKTVSRYKGKAEEMTREVEQLSKEVKEISKEADKKIEKALKKIEETAAE